MPVFALCILLLTSGGAPARAAEVQASAPLAPEARGAILDLSLALSRLGVAGPELVGFSSLSARLNLSREPVSNIELAAYARMAGELVERSASAKEPVETAAALKLVSDALAPRLDASSRATLERARGRLLEAGGAALMARARGMGDALAADKPAQALPPGPALRPAVEWWTLDGRRYDTTAQLLNDWKPRPGEQAPAVYHFRRSASESQTRTLAGWVADAKGRAMFVIDGSAAAPVDLERHAGARISPAPGFAGQGSDGFNGAVMMLAASLATLTPHGLGVLVSGAVASILHTPLDLHKAVPYRAALAAIVLMLIQLAEVTVSNGHGWSSLHTVSLIWGAMWGLTMLPRLRAAKSAAAVENGQWWAAAPVKSPEPE